MRTSLRIALLTGIVLLLFKTSVSQVFSPPQNVSSGLGFTAGAPQVAFGSSGTAYLIWQDQDVPAGKTDFDIFFTRSGKRLDRLARPDRLAAVPGNAYANTIATAGRAVYVAWEEFTPDGADTNYRGDRYDVMFAASRNGGAAFMRAISVNPEAPSSIAPQLATAPDGTVYLAWADFRTGDIYLRSSRNGGRTLAPAINISNDAAYSSEPQIAVDTAGTVHIAWTSGTPGGSDIFYAHSPDGLIFSSPQDVSATIPGQSYSPRIAVASGFVYVGWISNTVWLSRSPNGGLSFELPQDISSPTEQPVLVQLAAAASNVYVLFTGYEPFFTKAFLAHSNDSGSSFSGPLRLSDAWSEGPHLSASGNRADLVWQDRSTGNFEVLHTRTLDGGGTWTPVQNVSNTPGESTEPWVAARPDGVVAVTWTEDAADIWWTTTR